MKFHPNLSIMYLGLRARVHFHISKMISKESTMGMGGSGISLARNQNRKTTGKQRKLQVSLSNQKWNSLMKLHS